MELVSGFALASTGPSPAQSFPPCPTYHQHYYSTSAEACKADHRLCHGSSVTYLAIAFTFSHIGAVAVAKHLPFYSEECQGHARGRLAYPNRLPHLRGWRSALGLLQPWPWSSGQSSLFLSPTPIRRGAQVYVPPEVGKYVGAPSRTVPESPGPSRVLDNFTKTPLTTTPARKRHL